MTDTELIARQAKLIEELSLENSELKERIRKANLHIHCIGGPLNDNRLGYSFPQLMTFKQIEDALGY